MCIVIKADYLLATVLSDENVRSVSFDSLNEIRREIELRCADVVVDVSPPSIHCALECFPEIFVRSEGQISRAEKAKEYLSSDYLDDVFTGTVPDAVNREVRLAIKSAIS